MRHTPDCRCLTVRHTSNCRCLTVRHTTDCRCLTVRHTPAFGHPSPRGDGLPHRFDCQLDYQCIAAAPSPLGEGWPKAGVCRISRSNCEAVNENKGRGVSHRQTNAIHRFSVGPSGLFYCVSSSAGVALRATFACNPSLFQG